MSDEKNLNEENNESVNNEEQTPVETEETTAEQAEETAETPAETEETPVETEVSETAETEETPAVAEENTDVEVDEAVAAAQAAFENVQKDEQKKGRQRWTYRYNRSCGNRCCNSCRTCS